MRDLSHTNLQAKTSKFFTTYRVNLCLLFGILVLGLVYIYSINTMASAGFQIKQLSAELSELEGMHKKLELQNSSLQSVSSIQQKTAHLNFVPASQVTYLKDDSYALK